eukprot:gene38782-63467_t
MSTASRLPGESREAALTRLLSLLDDADALLPNPTEADRSPPSPAPPQDDSDTDVLEEVLRQTPRQTPKAWGGYCCSNPSTKGEHGNADLGGSTPPFVGGVPRGAVAAVRRRPPPTHTCTQRQRGARLVPMLCPFMMVLLLWGVGAGAPGDESPDAPR